MRASLLETQKVIFVFTYFLFYFLFLITVHSNPTFGVMVSMLASIAVDHGFDPQSGQTKDYEIGICCFSAKHAALRRTSKDWLARNQDNVSADCCFSELAL